MYVCIYVYNGRERGFLYVDGEVALTDLCIHMRIDMPILYILCIYILYICAYVYMCRERQQIDRHRMKRRWPLYLLASPQFARPKDSGWEWIDAELGAGLGEAVGSRGDNREAIRQVLCAIEDDTRPAPAGLQVTFKGRIHL